MIARAPRRIPGVHFESRPPRLVEALPRMDVAAFVGFAASGPLNTPVVVEDPAEFLDIFGQDIELAWDAQESEQRRANLGPAVRSFFKNGGRRCWVVRVARSRPPGPASRDRNFARESSFPIPGVLKLSSDGKLRPAFAQARSEGSWADRLSVSSSLTTSTVVVAEVRTIGDGIASLRVRSASTVTTGDLLRLRWPDGSVLLAPVAAVEHRLERDELDPRDARRYVEVGLTSGKGLWVFPQPPGADAVSASWFPREGAPSEPLTLIEGPSFESDGTASMMVTGDGLAPGHWVLLERAGDQVWFLVTARRGRSDMTSPPELTTELGGRWFRVSTTPPPTWDATTVPLVVERLRVELSANEGAGPPRRLGNLGLAAGHERYLGALPPDRLLYESDDEPLDAMGQSLRAKLRELHGNGTELRALYRSFWQEVATPRFPLALDPRDTEAFFPLGASATPEHYLGRIGDGDAASERDGLAVFNASLFVDDALRGEPAPSLRARAEHLRWQQPVPRRLRGLHALLDVDEATLIAVPDATQRAWSKDEVELPSPLPTPLLVTSSDAGGRVRLSWDSVHPRASYVLEESESAAFSSPRVHVLKEARSYAVPPPPPRRLWFRVRAYLPESELADGSAFSESFASEAVEVVQPPPDFVACSAATLPAVVLVLASPPDQNGSYRLEWSTPVAAARFAVEESETPDFEAPRRLIVTGADAIGIFGKHPSRYHYRVRAEDRDGLASSAWSNPIKVVVSPPSVRLVEPEGSYAAQTKAELLVVQGALLRLAAARGDQLAILGLPAHYREAEAVAHVAELRASVPEAEAWSYGALYHPWLFVEGSGELFRTSPEGAISGMLADRAAARGAWVAPANQPLGDVLGLSPTLTPDERQRLYDASVNVVRREPHGFVTLSADTLSTDPDLMPIHARRLLSLLRRLALQLGPTFVFEPNSGMFRRSVEREFTRLLDGMHRAGAFAGPTAESSYEVNVDASLNTRQNVDQGRFIVELKVAPSQPLSFLSVRLVQSGIIGHVTEGA